MAGRSRTRKITGRAGLAIAAIAGSFEFSHGWLASLLCLIAICGAVVYGAT